MARLSVRVGRSSYLSLSLWAWLLLLPFLVLFWTAAALGWLLVQLFKLLGLLIAALERRSRATARR